MWMMGYNDHGGELNLHDSSFNGTTRRLRPLIPRPLPSSTTLNSPSSNPPCFFAQYQQHLGNLGEQSKREFINSTSSNNNAATTAQVVVSSRWNPTPEQLRALEELYRRGTRTPSAEQIQHITAQLRRYGKIEGKNVFYWFQNHKARERQKRRRQMESGAAGGIDAATQRNEELGSSRTVYEVNQTKNWPPSSNCSTTLAEESLVSIPRAVSENNNNNNNYKVAAESSAMQARTDGWTQLCEMELHNRWNINNNKMNGFVDRNATWKMMQLSCPSPHHLSHLINTRTSTTTSSTITTTTTTTTTTNNTTDHININTTKTASTMDQGRLMKSSNITQQEHPSSFITPRYNRSDHMHHQNGLVIHSCDSSQIIKDHQDDDDDDDDYIHDNICTSSEESQTLQLFPLRSRGDFLSDKEAVSGTNASTPCQFFEFLPLKN